MSQLGVLLLLLGLLMAHAARPVLDVKEIAEEYDDEEDCLSKKHHHGGKGKHDKGKGKKHPFTSPVGYFIQVRTSVGSSPVNGFQSQTFSASRKAADRLDTTSSLGSGCGV